MLLLWIVLLLLVSVYGVVWLYGHGSGILQELMYYSFPEYLNSRLLSPVELVWITECFAANKFEEFRWENWGRV